jgi:hypothetical protein
MKRIDHQKSITKEIKRNQENIMIIKNQMNIDILARKIKVTTQKYQTMIVNRFMVIINSITKINGLRPRKKLKIRNMIINTTERNINKKKNIRNRMTATTNIVEIKENKTHLKSNKKYSQIEKVLKNKIKKIN